jgi:putative nucleotidyltransferase with HDIG domain
VPDSVRRELEARLVEGKLELPLLPAVAMELTSAAAREDVDMRVLAEMLKRDPALSAHVLRVVNSPLYSPRGQIVSLQQAVARVGASKIREISLVIACKTGVFKVKGFEREIAEIFQHSVATALFGQEIARQTRNNVEDAFLCGLLHDVGRPVLLQALGALLREARVAVDRPAVLELVSAQHELAGGALARAWGLPETVQAAIREHHGAALDTQPNAVRITALADCMAHGTLDPGADPARVANHPAIALLDIYPDVLEKITKLAANVQKTTGVLS